MVPGRLDSSGRVVKGDAFVHKGFLSGLYADAPARAKVLYTICSFIAYLACAYCRLTATRKGGVNRYLGYTEPVTSCAGPGAGQAFDMTEAGAAGRRYNEATVDALIDAAEGLRERGLSAADQLGFHGKSPLLTRLSYIDASMFAVVPFAHAFCQGVAKDFFKAIFAPFSKTKKQQGPAGLGDGGALPHRPGKRARQGSSGRGCGQAAVVAAAAAAATAGRAGPSSGGGGAASGGGQSKAQVPVLPAEKLVPHRQRTIIRERAKGWLGGLHPQKNRPYRDVIRYKVRAGGSRPFLAAVLGGCGRPAMPMCCEPKGGRWPLPWTPPPPPHTRARARAPTHSHTHTPLLPQGCWQIDDVVQGMLALLGPIFWPVTDSRGQVAMEILPDPHIKTAYGCLRRFAEFHLTEHEFSTHQELEDAVDEAQGELLKYARLAEQVRRRGLAACALVCGGACGVPMCR